MTLSLFASLIIVIGTIYALIKRYETRLVLITAGFLMACISLDPMMAFHQFDASMTKSSLIIAICSAMGFASVIALTKCDVHLVALLLKPVGKLGIFLLPVGMCITAVCSVAITSTAGICAAIGPTLIPILVRAGFHPAIAAGSIVASVFPAYYNPGIAHNVFVAKLADMEVMDLIILMSDKIFIIFSGLVIGLTAVCLIYKDFRKDGFGELTVEQNKDNALPEKVNIFYAVAPLIPVAILLYCTLYTDLKISVATAMLIGAAYALTITRSNPADVTRKFFDGMGKAYANILGIIIAAGVFAAGLKAAGVIDLLVDFLRNSNEWAKIGGSVGPYVMGLMTGSGDAAAFAFNEAVTPHAAQFGTTIPDLGYLAVMAGALGRTSSPLCGGLIIAAGIAGVNPVEIVKRTAPACLAVLAVTYVIF